jgi:hypothetical protein
MKTQIGIAALALTLAGCLGSGGAVNARWRIVELSTGRFNDPRDISDADGVCCEPVGDGSPCSGSPAWRIATVRVQLADPSTGVELADAPGGLTATCGEREFTTPFSLPSGLFAINLIADSSVVLSPSPELRTVSASHIVNLDLIDLTIPQTIP